MEPTATSSPAAPAVEDGAAVLISLGDSGSYSCCGTGLGAAPALAAHIAERLDQPVQLVSFTAPVSGAELIAGSNAEPSLLSRAASAVHQYEGGGHAVVGIVLSIGAHDIEELRKTCGPGCQPEIDELVRRYGEQLGVIYSRLNQTMQQPAPVLQSNFFDALTCENGGSAEPAGFSVDPFNQTIAAAVPDNDGFVVDVAAAVKPGMCTGEGTLTQEGQSAVGAAFQSAYDSLPDVFRP